MHVTALATTLLASSILAAPFDKRDDGLKPECKEEAVGRYQTRVECTWQATFEDYAANRAGFHLPEDYMNATLTVHGASGGTALNSTGKPELIERGLGLRIATSLPDGFNGSICVHPGVNGQDASVKAPGLAPMLDAKLPAAGNGGKCSLDRSGSFGGAGGTLSAVTFSDSQNATCNLLSLSNPKAEKYLIIGGAGGSASSAKYKNQYHASPGGSVGRLLYPNHVVEGAPGYGITLFGHRIAPAGGSNALKVNETEFSLMLGKSGEVDSSWSNCMATGGGGSGYRGGQGGVPQKGVSGSGGAGSSALIQKDPFMQILSSRQMYTSIPKIVITYIRHGQPQKTIPTAKYSEVPADGQPGSPKSAKSPVIDVIGDDDL